MVAELDRYADLQRAMATAKDDFDGERCNLLTEKQAALDGQAADYNGQLSVSWPSGVRVNNTKKGLSAHLGGSVTGCSWPIPPSKWAQPASGTVSQHLVVH